MIDFSTVTSWTIPEGDVNQVTDASGNVIWKHLPPVVYLRPSADISLTHPVYPETLGAGYLAISEEVSDGSSTYIGYLNHPDTENDGDATSKFIMSLDKRYRIKNVLSATLIIDGLVYGNLVSTGYEDYYIHAECSCNVYVGGVNVFSKTICTQNSSTANGFEDMNNTDIPDLVSALNSYISANGVGNIPEVSIEIWNYAKRCEDSQKVECTTSSYVSQVAIALECE